MKDIKERLFSVIPTASLHMIEFLKILNIRIVKEGIDSAAVTCKDRPELLLNEDFINEFCKSDEHLFMLVMHELYHVILGHTKLFKRHTMIDNVAFDAIINAMLCRMFPEEEYVSFFKEINPDNSFPGCILRPVGKNTDIKYYQILKNLYFSNTGTYYEVYECICNELKNEKNFSFLLLGNHSDNDDCNNPLINKMLDDVISKWPREMIIKGRDLGGALETKEIKFEKTKRKERIKMIKLLKKAGLNIGCNLTNKRNISLNEVSVETVIPDYRDRMILSKTMIYNNPVLYNSKTFVNELKSESKTKTFVYLDVSGSVNEAIKEMMPLLLKPNKNNECSLFVFSTVVCHVTYKDLKFGRYESTGGTDINCIFDHYFSLPKNKQVKKILILTDGYTGKVRNDYEYRIKKNNIKVYCGLFGKYNKKDLENITTYFEEFD